MSHQIETDRFILRELVEQDATQKYLNWFQEESAKEYIIFPSQQIEELKNYIQLRLENPNSLFLGIFSKVDNTHIGNVKFEPIDRDKGFATMGILIGEPDWRGKGVSKEVIGAGAKYLQKHFSVNRILLGVKKVNTSAIKAYEKLGFVIEESEDIFIHKDIGISMIWHLER